MEPIELNQEGASLHIAGFRDAAKLIALADRKSKRLADLALHRADLTFAAECLAEVTVGEKSDVTREALWRSAIVHFIKCFGESRARSQLSIHKILSGEPPQALAGFEFFRVLRNKHLVHDENSWAQALPGAVLNRPDAPHKIAKVVCISLNANTIQGNDVNLRLLIEKALRWVGAEFDRLAMEITEELEARTYGELDVMPEMNYSWPDIRDVEQRRGGR